MQYCVTAEDGTERVRFRINGLTSPDLTSNYAVVYLPPDEVRYVTGGNSPDLVFGGKTLLDEARRLRRMDPLQLVEELEANPGWVVGKTDGGRLLVQYPGSEARVELHILDGKLMSLHTTADMPLRGRVSVEWRWHWSDDDGPDLELFTDGERVFTAHASRRTLDDTQRAALWRPSNDMEPRTLPGVNWPASVDMTLEVLAENVYMVRGVRTGSHHMVVDTPDGLVVGDAPAGWVELPQIPPADLVPGLGISGLSERFIDFLGEKFPDRPIRAVILTHAHDDHAGGARAFAAAGADVYAPASVAEFLGEAFNRREMPRDRLAEVDGTVLVHGVSGRVSLGSVEIVNIGRSPHVAESIGVWARDGGYFFQSDMHIPNSEDNTPREDRAATECWFASWAAANLPAEAIVVGSHGSRSSPVSRLARYTESEVCRKR